MDAHRGADDWRRCGRARRLRAMTARGPEGCVLGRHGGPFDDAGSTRERQGASSWASRFGRSSNGDRPCIFRHVPRGSVRHLGSRCFHPGGRRFDGRGRQSSARGSVVPCLLLALPLAKVEREEDEAGSAEGRDDRSDDMLPSPTAQKNLRGCAGRAFAGRQEITLERNGRDRFGEATSIGALVPRSEERVLLRRSFCSGLPGRRRQRERPRWRTRRSRATSRRRELQIPG